MDKPFKALRRVQALGNGSSLTVCLPKEFASKLNIRKQDFLSFQLEEGVLVVRKL